MRIAIGQLWQETNTFNPLPTTRQDFENFGVVRPPFVIASHLARASGLPTFLMQMDQKSSNVGAGFSSTTLFDWGCGMNIPSAGLSVVIRLCDAASQCIPPRE